MENVFLSGGLAFLITFFSIPVIIELAVQKKLFDEPNGRKVHKKVIPTLGGLGIFAGLMIATLIGTPVGASGSLQYFVAACLVLFFLGIKDDILILSASKKFLGQLFAAGIIIKFGGIQIQNMYGLFGIHELAPTVSLLLTVFTIIVITNSFNLIDGVDGLAGSLGVFTSLIFGLYFYQSGQALYAVMAISLVGSLLAFLIYNFSPAKIFMGDTGSLLIGFLNSIFVIRFITTAGDPASALPIASAPAIGFAILIVPLFDTLRVVAIRVFNRRSPFSPDRNHIHHFLLDIGFRHTGIVGVCIVANIAFIALAYFLRDLGTTSVMLALSGASLAAIGIVYYSKERIIHAVPGKNTVVLKEPVIQKEHKVITLNGKKVEQESSAI
ncbi:MAG TPA: MraY family glycosyltransferase [Ginsengibacter sp.]|nr:undecaprenyl/decaprenyl-phosphate alpha-N-acetylglucosaminyl 1-phosphate transferase [Chitinophagaceae bacterium]HRN71669.1 MraY family glycosyltransferase [Ginsengibacter sp.]HRP44271.1 MraY family glycosyltransferase [Ginsengibacter sp.]